jgi:hypothetical protein
MKKQFLQITIALALQFVMLQSCKKDSEETKATVAMGSATITGRITADMILNNGTREGVSGIKVIGRINTADLITTGTVATAGLTRTYEATTDADGNYTLTVEVNSKPVGVTLDIPASFNAEQTLENGTKKQTVFTRNTVIPGTITVNRSQTVTQNADYDYAINAILGTVKLSGEVKFRNDLCKGISAALDSQVNIVPTNTILVVTWNDDNFNSRELEVAVGTNGKYEFMVETQNASKALTIRGRKFYADRKSPNPSDSCITAKDYGYTLPTQNVTINKNESEVRNFTFQ